MIIQDITRKSYLALIVNDFFEILSNYNSIFGHTKGKNHINVLYMDAKKNSFRPEDVKVI